MLVNTSVVLVVVSGMGYMDIFIGAPAFTTFQAIVVLVIVDDVVVSPKAVGNAHVAWKVAPAFRIAILGAMAGISYVAVIATMPLQLGLGEHSWRVQEGTNVIVLLLQIETFPLVVVIIFAPSFSVSTNAEVAIRYQAFVVVIVALFVVFPNIEDRISSVSIVEG